MSSKLRTEFGPRELLALVFITGGFILIYLEKDGLISSAIGAVIGFYFGSESTKEAMMSEPPAKSSPGH